MNQRPVEASGPVEHYERSNTMSDEAMDESELIMRRISKKGFPVGDS